MALTTRDVMAQRMRELTEIRIAQLKDELGFGGGIERFDQYREKVGHLRGLSEALELLEQAVDDVNNRERGL